MVAKKQPSNFDLAAKLDTVMSEVKQMTHRVNILESWKMQEDAYKAALKQVKRDENDSNSEKEVSARTQLWINLGKLAALLVIAVGAYLAGKGIHQ